MRAHYYPELIQSPHYLLEGDSLHHLVHVVRVEKDEEILLLSGKGKAALTKVESITKKQMVLKFLEWREESRSITLDLALGIPKKEALELSLKEATELGFRRIYLVRGEYSQIKVPDVDRMTNVLVSALEQANAFYLPEIIESNWQEIPWNEYSSALLLDSQSKQSAKAVASRSLANNLLIVGPEGGFSPQELIHFRQNSGIESLYLPTPILRTTTAVAVGAGVLLQRLMD